MRALVTGITGFAGSHLAEHLLACGDELLGCSRRADFGSDSSLDPSLLDIPLIRWDLAEGFCDEAARQIEAFAPEVIFHLAARSVPRHCGASEPTEEALACNVRGTESIVTLALQLPHSPRFLLASSCYVYAPVAPGQCRVDERSAVAPSGGYGRTKWLAEQCVQQATAQGLEGVIARAFQHTGPRQSPQMMLPEWIEQLVRPGDQSIRVLRRNSFLDLSDVRDIVRAYRKIAVSGGHGEVYNVGSGVCVRSGDILERLFELCGCRRPVEEFSAESRYHPIADISRLQAATGWRPEIPLDNTLLDTWRYWETREHRR